MKLLKYIGLSFLGLSLNSCTDYLDNAPDDTLTMEMVFNDKTRTEDWLSGVYNRVPDPYWSLLRDYGYDSLQVPPGTERYGVNALYVSVLPTSLLKMLMHFRIRELQKKR